MDNNLNVRFNYMDTVGINKSGLEDTIFKITRELNHEYYEIEGSNLNKYKASKDIIFLKNKSKIKLDSYVNPYDEYIIRCKKDEYSSDYEFDKIIGNIVNFRPITGQIVVETKDGLYINKVSNIIYMKKKAVIISKIEDVLDV